jgi:hypothetical protein
MIKDIIMREKRQRSHPLPHACELEKKAVVVVGRPVPQGNLLIHAWRQPHPHKIVGRGGELEYLASGQAGGDVFAHRGNSRTMAPQRWSDGEEEFYPVVKKFTYLSP